MKIRELVIFCLTLVYQFAEYTQSDVHKDEELISKLSIETLQFVAVVTRHGSRPPASTYPNDPYPYDNRLFWPNGPMELTSYGKRQLFLTGENLRKRYLGFLPQHFHPNDTLVEYDDNDRDYASGACILAALYPPIGGEIWNSDLLWQPIPLYNRNYDFLELADGNKCPVFKAEVDAWTAKVNLEGNQNKTVVELLKNVSFHTGSNITSISELAMVNDNLIMLEENGFKLPSWTKDYFPEPIRSTVIPMVTTIFSGSENILRIGIGPELKYISDMFNMKANRTHGYHRKLYIEAAHDATIIALLMALGNKDPLLEARTSAYMIFELHTITPIEIIQVLHFKNSSDLNPEYININGCPSPCSLENFTKLVDKINPSNWNEMCHNENYFHSKNLPY